MLPSFLNQAYTRKRYPTVLDHGAQVIDYSATPAYATFYGSIQPGSGAVDQINRDGAEVVFTIFTTPGSDITHRDHVTLGDGTYFVNGEPEQWRTGILDHDVIRLSRWKG